MALGLSALEWSIAHPSGLSNFKGRAKDQGLGPPTTVWVRVLYMAPRLEDRLSAKM